MSVATLKLSVLGRTDYIGIRAQGRGRFGTDSKRLRIRLDIGDSWHSSLTECAGPVRRTVSRWAWTAILGIA